MAIKFLDSAGLTYFINKIVYGITSPKFSTGSTYTVGDFVIYTGNLYRCTTAVTVAGAWSASKWVQTTVKAELSELKNMVGDLSQIENGTYNNIAKLLQYYIDNGYLPDVNLIPLIPTLTATNSNILANGDNAGYPAWGAFDNSDSTRFITNASGNYIGYTFTAPVIVKKITWKGDTSYLGFSISAKLQGSNDNTTWVDVQNLSGGSTSIAETRLISGTTKYKYWRVIDSGIRFGLMYLQFYGN